MATVKAYAVQMRQQQIRIARKLGVDVSTEPAAMRVLLASVLAIVAVLVKLLVDKGVLTDAELATAFNLAGDDTYVTEPEPPNVV